MTQPINAILHGDCLELMDQIEDRKYKQFYCNAIAWLSQ